MAWHPVTTLSDLGGTRFIVTTPIMQGAPVGVVAVQLLRVKSTALCAASASRSCGCSSSAMRFSSAKPCSGLDHRKSAGRSGRGCRTGPRQERPQNVADTSAHPRSYRAPDEIGRLSGALRGMVRRCMNALKATNNLPLMWPTRSRTRWHPCALPLARCAWQSVKTSAKNCWM